MALAVGMLHLLLLLGGAAVYRCDNRRIFSAALAAGEALAARNRVFQHSV
jgi:hypothetical protein